MQEFHEQLESTIKEIPRKGLIIQGDWNGKVGPDAYEQWPGRMGRFGVGEISVRGEGLLEFTYRHKMTVVDNFFLIRSPKEQHGIRQMASRTTRLTIFSQRGDSSPVSIEPRVEYIREQISAIRLG